MCSLKKSYWSKVKDEEEKFQTETLEKKKCKWHFDKWQQSKRGGTSAEAGNKAAGALIISLEWLEKELMN